MKKLISLFLIASLIFSSVSFAAGGKPKPTATTLAPTVTTAKTPVNFKLNESKDVSTDFAKTFLHTAKNFEPYVFELTEADFATNKWQKYVAAVYVQATDVNYFVSTLYADGALKQVILLTSTDVQTVLDDAKKTNEEIRAESIAKPDASFTPFFKNVYQAPWMLIDEKALITTQFMTKNDIQNKYPDLLNILSDNYRVIKKGSFYILMTTTYPTGTWNSLVSSSTTEIDVALGKFIAKNNDLLLAAKLIEAPKPVVKPNVVPAKLYYVLLINKDKTYTIKEFKTVDEAKKFHTASVKKYGKANALYFDLKTLMDKSIANLKLKKKK